MTQVVLHYTYTFEIFILLMRGCQREPNSALAAGFARPESHSLTQSILQDAAIHNSRDIYHAHPRQWVEAAEIFLHVSFC